MDAIRIGLQLRALRLLKELRQDDLARIAQLSRALVSRVERGLVENVRVGDLERVAKALGARLDVRLRWNGEGLDRLLDEVHAALVDAMVALLRAAGWEVAVEVSFSIWGERGSIDILAYHSRTGTLLVIEVKSAVPDSQEMLATLDRKAQLARQIAGERGWEVRSVARLLVVADTMTARRRVARLASTFETAFPLRGHAVRRWLRQPAGSISGLLFLSYAPAGSSRKGSRVRQRVRKPSRARFRPESHPTAHGESV